MDSTPRLASVADDSSLRTPSALPISRRHLLAGVGTVAAVGLAGCLGGGTVAPGGDPVDDVLADGPLANPVAGDPDGRTTIRVFSDFACPHCRRFHLEEFPKLEAGLLAAGGVRYEHYDFPIPVDATWSWRAARAARAVQADAGDAAFWAFAAKLYENQGRLTLPLVERLADEVGADGAFVRRAADRQFADVIQADRDFGDELGVPGTPGVVVAGRLVSPTAAAIEDAVDAASA